MYILDSKEITSTLKTTLFFIYLLVSPCMSLSVVTPCGWQGPSLFYCCSLEGTK